MPTGKNSFILINSDDRIQGSASNTDFICFLNDFNNLRGDVAISLESCEFHNTQYPIRDNYNNQFRFNEDVAPGTYYTITIPNGVYSATQIATEIATLMTAAGTFTYSGTYNIITKKISITTIIPDTWSFDSSSLTYSVNKYIGFPETNNTLQVGHVGTLPVNLAGSLYVDLECVGWSNDNIHTGGKNNIVHRVPLIGSFGDYVHFQNSDSEDFTKISNEQLQYIHIRLLNPDGSSYSIPSNFDVSVNLRFNQVE